MTNESDSRPPQIIIYETDDRSARVSVRLDGETVWLTNQQLAQLFHVSKSTVSEHIKNIFDSGELSPDAVVRNFRTTAVDGKNYDMSFYNLDMIISLGYLDFAERQAERQAPMTMRDWAKHLDKILTATGERLLADAGSVSHEQAIEKARSEYVKYQARTLSDVEKQYLASLKIAETTVKKRGKK